MGFHNPREHQHIDLGGACAQQRPRAGVDRCTRRQHIIDQQQPAALQRGRRRSCANRERALNIAARSVARQADLMRGRTNALQRVRGELDAGLPRDRPRQRAGLVVAPRSSRAANAAAPARWIVPRQAIHGRRAPSSDPSPAPDPCGPGISAHERGCGRYRRSARRRARDHRRADRRSPASTGRPGLDRRQRECRAAGKKAAR